MRLRTKLWYISVGNYAELAIFGAYARNTALTIWGFLGAIGSWYYAEHLRKEEEGNNGHAA